MQPTRAVATLLLGLLLAPFPVAAQPDPPRILTGLWDGRVDIHVTSWPGPDCRLFFYQVSPAVAARWSGKAYYLSPRLRTVINVEGDAFGDVVTVRFPVLSYAMVRLAVTPVRNEPMLIGAFRYNGGVPIGVTMYLSKVKPGAKMATPGFLGTWLGAWENPAGEHQIDTALVVEKTDGASVKATYLWGTAPQLGINAPGQFLVTGTIDAGDTLRISLPTGAQVVYRLSADQQTLAGEHTREGRVGQGLFRRVPP